LKKKKENERMSANFVYMDPASAATAQQRNAGTIAAIEQARQQIAQARVQQQQAAAAPVTPVAAAPPSGDVIVIVDGACPGTPAPAPPATPVLHAPNSPAAYAHPYMPASPLLGSPASYPVSPYPVLGAAGLGAPTIAGAFGASPIAINAAAASAQDAHAIQPLVAPECKPDRGSCVWPWIILIGVIALLAIFAGRYFSQRRHHDDADDRNALGDRRQGWSQWLGRAADDLDGFGSRVTATSRSLYLD
jgi:hypothetical protein